MKTPRPVKALLRLIAASFVCLLFASSAAAQFQTANSGVSLDFQTSGIYSNPGNFAICSVSARLNNDGRIEIGGCMRSNAPGIASAQYTAQLQVIDGANGAVLATASVFSVPLPGAQADIPFPQRFFTPASPVGAGANLELIFTLSMPDGNTWVLDTRGKPDGQFITAPNPDPPGSYNWTTRRYTANNFPTRCGGFSSLPSCPNAGSSSFGASPGSINQGDSSTLTWNVPGASSVTISGVGTFGASGSVSVSPSSTTTYTLTGTGAQDCVPVTLQATVDVAAACPTVAGSSFSSSPSSIVSGDNSTLSWNVPNASSVTIAGVGTFGPSGSVSVSPGSTTTYTLTSSGGGSCAPITLQATVTVAACPTAAGSSFSSSPGTIALGGNSTLTWSVPGASSVTIAGVGTFGASGSVSVSPSSSTTYTLTSSGAGSCAAITLQATVNVTPCPTVAGSSFSSSPSSIVPGGGSTLSWSVPNATSVTIAGVGTFAASGSVAVNPSSTTTYTLTATGAGSCAAIQLQATVNVAACPTVAGSSFSASPSAIVPGGTSTLSWNVPGATSVTIAGVGTFGPSGSVAVSPTASSTTYTLTSTGAGSCAPITLQATVTVASCPTAAGSSFSASPSTIALGGTSTLSWNVPNATSVTIAGVPGTFGASGSVSVSPSSTTTFTLTAAGPGSCASIQLQATVNVTPCPTVAASTFSSSPGSIALGGNSTLTWNVPNATSVTIAGVGTFGPSGSVPVSPSSSTTYTLTATGAGSCAAIQLQATVNVTPCPTVAGSSFSSSPSSIVPGGNSTLTWNIPNATSVTISGVAGTFGASGSVSVSPGSTTTYTLTATGAGSCASVQLQTTVSVASCPTVAGSSFSAAPSTIGSGGSSTLTWNVPNATSVTISGVGTFGASGSVSVSPGSTTTYTLTASGPGTCAAIQIQATVSVAPCPTVAGSTFTSTPNEVVLGQTATLTWNVPNATSVTISGVPGTFGPSGSVTVSPTATTTYTLTATGSGSCPAIQLQRTVFFVACPSPASSTFTASQYTITAGQTVTLTWSVPNATGVNLDAFAGNFPASGSVTVNPTSTRTYTLTANVENGCTPFTMQVTITVITGSVLIGPSGQPAAVGPTNNNDDYTNLSMTLGVAAPFGGTTSASQTLTFVNTVRNNATAADNVSLTLQSVPNAAFNSAFQISINGGASYQSFTVGTPVVVSVPAQSNFDVRIRVTVPVGQFVLTGYAAVIRATSGITPSIWNETIDRSWAGFVRADKTQTVTNSTGVGAANAPVRGAVIEYVLSYSNVSPAATGTGNVNLTATNLVLTENGTAAPNNWGTTTTHVAGSASDSRGGTITGDTAGSSLLTDTVPSLPPAATGTFRFRRVIN